MINKRKEEKRMYYINNKDRIMAGYRKRFNNRSPESIVRIKKYQKDYFTNNKDKILEQQKSYNIKNKKRRAIYQSSYRANHKVQRKNYELANRVKLNSIAKKHRLKVRDNINFKVKNNLCGRIWYALKSKTTGTKLSEYIGCSIPELKRYLESKFDKDMNWNNYGEFWEIDHGIPVHFFDLSKKEEVLSCFNYTNLKPMRCSDNRSKMNRYIEISKDFYDKEKKEELKNKYGSIIKFL